jgi:hypothetical protein
VGFSEGPLCPDYSLCNGRLRDEECTGDLVCGQATQQAESKSDACILGEDGMTGDEDEPQEVISYLFLGVYVKLWRFQLLLDLKFAAELLLFALKADVSANLINGTTLCGCHQPGARFIGNA